MANILLIEADYETKFAPLGLMRISSMHKSKGDNITYFKGIKKFPDNYIPDKVYITTLFTYEYEKTIKTVRYYVQQFKDKCSEIWVGGILASTRPDLFYGEGVKVHIGLIEEAEQYPPDYDLFPNLDYSLTMTSRGCVNKCFFCVVPSLEGNLKHRNNWVQDINLKFKRIIFMDNNWLAKEKQDFESDIIQLKEFVKQGVIQIDFNQSLDCRLFSEDKAKIMQGLPINPFRLSFDHMGQDKHFQEAVAIAKKYGFKNIRVDILYNWMDRIEDFYYRLKEVSMLTLGTGGCGVFMRYAPLDVLDRKDHVGKHWTKKEVDSVNRINPYPYGQLSPKSLEEFEYFFGKDAEEFRKLLNYPDIKKLTVLKRNNFNKSKIKNIL